MSPLKQSSWKCQSKESSCECSDSVVTKWEGTRHSQLLINIIVRHTAVHGSVCMSKALNEDVSPRQGLSAHSNPAVDIRPHLPTFLNIFPKSHSPLLCLSVFKATYCANSYVSQSLFPSVCTQTSFFLFFSCFIPPSLFSPSDPVQMASRCCCNSFAFTYISSTNTDKKSLEETLTTYCMARSGCLKTSWVMFSKALGYTKQINTEQSKVAEK